MGFIKSAKHLGRLYPSSPPKPVKIPRARGRAGRHYAGISKDGNSERYIRRRYGKGSNQSKRYRRILENHRMSNSMENFRQFLIKEPYLGIVVWTAAIAGLIELFECCGACCVFDFQQLYVISGNTKRHIVIIILRVSQVST